MPKGFNLRCGAGKTERVWLQGRGGALTPGQAAVLLPIKEGETDQSPAAYRAPLRQALIDDNTGHVMSSCAKRTTRRSTEASSI